MATQAQPQYTTQIISNGSKWAGQAPDPIELLLERLSQYPLDPAFLSNRGEGTPYQHENEGSDLVTFAGNFTTFSGVFRIVTNDPTLVAELVARIEANETVKAWRAEHAGPKKSYYGTFSAIRDRHKATAAAAPGVDIPGLYELAERAHQGTSFSPEKRAESYTVENKAHLAADLGKIHAAGLAAGADAERIQETADRYQAGFISKLNAWLSTKSRCISTMITGGSNFPTRRAEKANSSEHNRLNEFIEYYEKGLARAIKSLSTPPTMQEQADKYAREAEQLEKMQELMKAGNRIVKAAKGADCTEKLVAAGLSEKLAAEAQKVVYGRAGFPAWMLTNNLANIKRVRARAAEVAEKAAAQQAASAATTAASARTFELNGQAGEVVVNVEVDRVQLLFDGKPDAETISQLKKNGFKWSPRFTAWQRQDTPNGRHAVRQLTGVDLNAPAEPVATVEQPAAVEVVAEVEPVQQLVAEAEQPATCEALEPVEVMQAVELEIDFNRLVLLADYHGPATAQQEARLPDWHALSTAQQLRHTEAEQAAARNGSPVTPKAQAEVTARALAGKLSEAQRRHLKWLGFEVPEYVVQQARARWTPAPAPSPEPADVASLEAGAAGPATAAQVYELPPFHQLRQAYDLTPNTGGASRYATIYAQGREWRVYGNAWERWAGMTERSAANSPRRARLEAERTEKKNKEIAAQIAKAGPLAAMFYGTPELAKARYTTAEEAKEHEMKRRQEAHDHHRRLRAASVHRIRQKLAAMPADEVAHFYTTWQRRAGGYGLEYILDAMHQLEKAKAKAQAEHVATEPEQPAPQLEASRPAAENWHVIERAAQVAPEHVAELEQLRALVQALPVAGRPPSLYEVVQLAQQLPAGSPYHVEGRADGLAIGYGPAEVLRLAPAGSWPPPASNYPPPRSARAAPIGTGYSPPRVAQVRPAQRAQVRLLPGGLEIYLPPPRAEP